MIKFWVFLVIWASSLSALTLDTAIERSLAGSPKLQASANEVGIASGIWVDQKALPNPIFSYSVENVFGFREWRGWRSAESRYELAQLIELGGKRGFRAQSAAYLIYAAQAEYESDKLVVLNRTTKSFIEVAAAQEKWNLAKKQEVIAEELLRTVEEKVEQGKISAIQKSKAEIEYTSAKLAAEKALVDLTIAKDKLASLWGDSCADFETVEWDFYSCDQPKDLECCLTDLTYNPEILKFQFLYLSACQNLNLEKSERIPNLTVTVGYKTLQENSNKGLILGASMPLQVFNQNQGGIQRARFEAQKLQQQLNERTVLLSNKLSTSYRDFARAFQEVERLQNSALFAANQAFELVSIGYREGKFEYSEMLDLEKTLYEVKARAIDAYLNYHKRKADIEFLNSQDL